ncbi:MAG: PT-TG domain-containing protein [Candidatus Midichloria mitochondrii]
MKESKDETLVEYISKVILRHAGMSKSAINAIYNSSELPRNKKIIHELTQQANALIENCQNKEGKFNKEVFAGRIELNTNKMLGQIGQGRIFDYKGDEKILVAGKRDKEIALEKGGTPDFDKKIENAILHQNNQRNRGVMRECTLRTGEVVKQTSKQAGNILFRKVVDSKLGLGLTFFIGMTIALGPAGPIAAAPLLGYFAYRVLDKVGIMKPLLGILKVTEKGLHASKSYNEHVLQNFESELSEVLQKTELSKKPDPAPEKAPEPDVKPAISIKLTPNTVGSEIEITPIPTKLSEGHKAALAGASPSKGKGR